MRKTFDAADRHLGERGAGPGTDGEIYDLVIRCVDFSTPGEPKVIYEKSGVRTKSVSEIPHLYVKEMLDKLYERAAAAPRGVNPEAEERWKSGKNLVTAATSSRRFAACPRAGSPAPASSASRWATSSSWVPEAGNDGNHVIRFTIPKIVAENEGVMYYSTSVPRRGRGDVPLPMPLALQRPEPQGVHQVLRRNALRVQGRAKRPADESGTSQRTPEVGQDRREVYRSQQNLKGENNVWNTQTEDFTPKHTKYTPKWGRIMLYGYLTEGVIDWDDVVVKQIIPPPAGFAKGDRRHSLGSKVTLKEMEENERRGHEGPRRNPPRDESGEENA